MASIGKPSLILSLLLMVGCGANNFPSESAYMQTVATADRGDSANVEEPAATLARKLIYSARVHVETTDFEKFSQSLVKKVEDLGGVLTNYQDERTSGDLRSGTWTVRIPSNQFNVALEWLDKTAMVLSKQVKSQDVTEEFVDLEARLQNKRNTEQRLKTILDERPGELNEILSVERELDRVREEIERVEGRLRFVKDQIALSTIEITANTRVEYLAKEVRLGQRVKEAWNGSLQDLRGAGESLIVEFVSWVPKLPLLAVPLFAVWLLIRYLRRKLFGSPTKSA
jgi:hypothetical protein